MTDAADTAPQEPAKRRWWVALLLFVFAACGYLYVGRPVRYLASLLYFTFFIGMLFVGPSEWLSQPLVFITFCLVALGIALFMVIDQIRLSLNQPNYVLRWYNRWWIYLGCFLIGAVYSFLPEILGGSGAQAVRTFSIPSVSGTPAVQLGDYIVVNNKAYQTAAPARGDVAVFSLPRDKATIWIKRIVGLPGDRIQMKNGQLFINDTAARREPAGAFPWPDKPPTPQFTEHMPEGRSFLVLDLGPSAGDNTKVLTVPAGHYFLIGDNRDNSSDSRFPQIGMVPRAHILGRATGIIFARDFRRIGSLIN